ncbi:MAG: L,D-transpeptidase [Gaiellaceae bacterium]
MTSHERAAAAPPARLLAAVLLACVAALVLAAGAGATAVAPTQRLAVLLRAHQAFTRPTRAATRIVLVWARRPLTDERTVLPVRAAVRGADGLIWLRVELPGRPNGHTGWIRRRGTRAAATRWHIVVETAARRVVVYRSGRPLRAFPAIVGKPSTPTPPGEFFVEEDVQLRPTDVGAPFALALSARSDVLQEFDGGPGQIALHGLSNIGGVLGTAVSHGCVRLADTAVRWLVVRIAPGVPVTIGR